MLNENNWSLAVVDPDNVNDYGSLISYLLKKGWEPYSTCHGIGSILVFLRKQDGLGKYIRYTGLDKQGNPIED